MKDENLLGLWICRFLLVHLVAERYLSRKTQSSYRDTLKLLLPFASSSSGDHGRSCQSDCVIGPSVMIKADGH
ncbi:hypothetical protein J5289_27645 (plasmid) [Rhizobium sp. B230/85]|uniref:hypothetical protein n=1 Tax=unclassified Rhizobium TaxID=2613769 RepID=UPI001ADA32FC|nr:MULTISPECIES: hypothetical protein [unclassified Rhizobium]MBO9136723.1 hypothetical protein [Rhizobium sp. B209b/85]QXZ99598.1 hypothetical protein J5289_27645 [Rhizobium sp. B230/85]